MTGVSEEEIGHRADANPSINGPTIVSRASKLMLEIENAGTPGSLKVFDVRGRMVKDLGGRVGSGPVVWTLDDGSGARVPAGIYFARYESGNYARTHKFIVTD